MIPLELQPTSAEVQKTLAFAMKWKSKTAGELAKIVKEKFDTVMDLIENDQEIALFVHDFTIKSNKLEQLKRGEIQRFRKLIIQAIENPNQSGSQSGIDWEVGNGEDFGSPELAKLAMEIRLLYSSIWYSKERVNDFSGASQDYLHAFLEFYWDAEDDTSDKNWTVKTKTKKSWKNKKEEKWKETEDDPYDGFLKAGDMVIVKTIITMLQSYLDALLRKMGAPNTAESTQVVLQKEVENGRWKSLAKITTKLKRIPFQHNIMENLEEFDYSFDDVLSTLLECWDSYGIQIQDMQDEK